MRLEEHERAYVEKVIDDCNGNRTLSAKILGLSRRALQRRLEKYRDKDASPSPRAEDGAHPPKPRTPSPVAINPSKDMDK